MNHHFLGWVNIPEGWVNMKQNGGSACSGIYNTVTGIVYPNPVVENFTISLPSSEIKEIAIYDSYERLIKEINDIITDNNELSLNVHELVSGIYFLKMVSPTEDYVIRFIKE